MALSPRVAMDQRERGRPLHVAIIMDGNGRWARARGLPRVAGHKRGAESVRSVVEAAPAAGVTHLTLFGFSSENWKRPPEEIKAVMDLIRYYLRRESDALHRNNVRLRFIGNRDPLEGDIVERMTVAEQKTALNSGLTLCLALNYGGRADITAAVKRIASDVACGVVALEDVDETMVSANVKTAGLPDPDLLIRTSGEQRISNFLLWQCAYAELMFCEACWPEFTGTMLADCIERFHRRERRFGAAMAG